MIVLNRFNSYFVCGLLFSVYMLFVINVRVRLCLWYWDSVLIIVGLVILMLGDRV